MAKVKSEIKSRWSEAVLFSLETESLKLAAEAAVKEGANLEGAYLVGANLEGANLEGAYLVGANGLEKFPLQVGGHKHWLCTTQDGKLQIGCHIYTFEDWQEHAEAIGRKEGYSPLDIEIYKLHIEHLKKVSQLLWNTKKGKD
jgi:Pentapeptide repeats (8 copies)